MAFLPDLSVLSLRKDVPLVATGPIATYGMKSKSFKHAHDRESKSKPTLVAKLLKDRGSNVDAWGKSTDAFPDNTESFLAVVRYLRDNTTYAHKYQAIQDLRKFEHWDATNLLPGGLICNEMDLAMDNDVGWLATMVPLTLPHDRGYYTRCDWSNNKVFVLGDFHGSLHSMLDVFLDMFDQHAFKSDGSGRLADDVAVVCLGDLLDRSPYTLECFYLMLRLCRENPGRCVLTAGNHETEIEQWDLPNGTWHEIQNENGNWCPTGPSTFRRRMQNITQALPAALIAKTSLGTLQFNHGAYEQLTEGSQQTNNFLKFVQFDPTTADTLNTMSEWAGNQLQWGDVSVDPAPYPEGGGRIVHCVKDVAKYLKTTGLSMLVRGHSDLANLSLLYAAGSEPPRELQDENAVETVPSNKKYPYWGHYISDPRPVEKREERGNTFIRKGYDFTVEEPGYDMHTLHQAPGADSFDKHLVTEKDGIGDLLVVTVASSPFSKPLPPVSMMSCYLAIGL